MKKRNQLLKYNMQYFADKGDAGQDGTDNSGEDGDDDQDDDREDKDIDDKSKKSDKKGKYLTQAEIDEMIEERLKRERKKAERKQAAKKDKPEDNPVDKEADENKAKLTALEEKVLCYDHDIAKEYVKEAIALAKAYVDEDTDMDEALDLVTKKFPQFVKGAVKKKTDDPYDDDEDETDNKKSWGQRQKGNSKRIDGVEAAFLKKNPGLKID